MTSDFPMEVSTFSGDKDTPESFHLGYGTTSSGFHLPKMLGQGPLTGYVSYKY